ncbi:MAG TPA: DnaA regulatory inactivator Hda [Desulfuromonadales bacterium]|nr:DnaA regulatory inactivator Hda [Desulfuromonadales bacterium]
MQQFFDFPITPSFGFDSFITCAGNASALGLARRVADPNDPEKLIYLHGPSGCGKTHLLSSIAGTGFPCITLRDTFTPDLIMSTFSNCNGMAIDDLHLMPPCHELRRALWQLFNEFHTSGRIIAMSGLIPPRDLDNLDEHLTSRLLWGFVVRLDTTDDESRSMILKKVADDRQIILPGEVIDYLLATASRDAGDLIKSFQKLYSSSMTQKRRITVQLAREIRVAESLEEST